MQGGDISNEVAPRLYLVFENLLGLLPSKKHEAAVAWHLKFKRYAKAVHVFELNEALAQRIWDVTWRLKFSVDVITWGNEQFAEAIRNRIDLDWDLPIAHVTSENPTNFARRMAYMPMIAAIYDPDPAHQFLFGSKSRIVSAANPDLIGAF